MTAKKSWVAGDQVNAADINANFTNDGQEETLTAGETINASTTPQAVYMDGAASKIKLADADNTSANEFLGFVADAQSVVLNDSVKVRMKGLVGGFSGLTVGSIYYLSTTAGAITVTAPETTPVIVGVAITATQLLLASQAEGRSASGTATDQASKGSGNYDETITIGWRPRFIAFRVTITTANATNDHTGRGMGNFSNGVNVCFYMDVRTTSPTFAASSLAVNSYVEAASEGSNNGTGRASILNITSTGFVTRFAVSMAGSGLASMSGFTWIAIR